MQINTLSKEIINVSMPGLQNIIFAITDYKKQGLCWHVYRVHTLELAVFLKLHMSTAVDIATDIAVVDTPGTEFRFTITYIFQSSVGGARHCMITKTNDLLTVASIQLVYPAFNWAEREIWDMFGIIFIKHPDLRRILTDYGFQSHPLRKYFPLSGFKELHYEESRKQIEYSGVEFSQAPRMCYLPSPWQQLAEEDEKEVKN